MDEDQPPTEDLDSTETVRPHSPIHPERIGPYRLLQKLGEGGMGVVFEAEQEKPVRRKVALKIIKPGMDSRQVLARGRAPGIGTHESPERGKGVRRRSNRARPTLLCHGTGQG